MYQAPTVSLAKLVALIIIIIKDPIVGLQYRPVSNVRAVTETTKTWFLCLALTARNVGASFQMCVFPID